ncbi:hypothetical protein ACO0K9_13245 [Undibacterium sp. Ji50W]|uniref:hypothetical protein n=1 Tax=Undibacterium sp. Ji50W TaxID=3413041 RepID=UPI003BEF52BE
MPLRIAFTVSSHFPNPMNSAFFDVITDSKLAHDLRQIADDFQFLEFFDQYDTCCFTMSAMLAHILQEKGYTARVQGCYAEIRQNNGIFYIGYKGFVRDRQREGHAVCIINEKYLVDFGLGTLRKFYPSDFSQALASEILNDEVMLASLPLENGMRIDWRIDWISPVAEHRLQAQVPVIKQAVAAYDDFQKNRMSYLVKKLFVREHKPSQDEHASNTALPLQTGRHYTIDI